MITITMVSTEGCHTCKEVKETLNKLTSEYDLSINEVDATTDKGQELIKKHNISSSPGLIINNEFFSSGKVTEKQLRNKFDTLE